uniref:Uncharacterized protein n=1 Tax=Schistosoma japonicum TaxID=6182 RepID=Q5BX53_SCHJA|nr:unknown [Schistosoma japonicum]
MSRLSVTASVTHVEWIKMRSSFKTHVSKSPVSMNVYT